MSALSSCEELLVRQGQIVAQPHPRLAGTREPSSSLKKRPKAARYDEEVWPSAVWTLPELATWQA